MKSVEQQYKTLLDQSVTLQQKAGEQGKDFTGVYDFTDKLKQLIRDYESAADSLMRYNESNDPDDLKQHLFFMAAAHDLLFETRQALYTKTEEYAAKAAADR